MPMRSKAQRAFLHIHEPEVAKRFERETPKGKRLPKKVSEDVGMTMTSAQLKEFLREAIPVLVLRELVMSGTVKSCSGVAPALAAVARDRGFDARVVRTPGHFLNVIQTSDGVWEVDLSAIQFEYCRDAPDERKEMRRLLQKVIKNPFAAVKIRRAEEMPDDASLPPTADKFWDPLDGYNRGLKRVQDIRSGKAEFLPGDPDRGYMSEPDDSVLKNIGEAEVDGKHISDDEEAILEPAAVNEGQKDEMFRLAAEAAYSSFMKAFEDKDFVRDNGEVIFHGEDFELSWELDDQRLQSRHPRLAPVLRGLVLSFLLHKDPEGGRASGYFHKRSGSHPNKIVLIPRIPAQGFTAFAKLARTDPKKVLGTPYHHKVFIHEFIHYLDFLRHKDPKKFGSSARRPEYSSYGSVYHNDPHEMNAFFQQAAANVQRLAGAFKGKWNKVWEDPKTFFQDAVLPHLHPGHWEKLSARNKRRILKRSYQLWQDLKRRHPTEEASSYPPANPPRDGDMRPVIPMKVDEADAVEKHTGTFFALKVPPDVAKTLAVPGGEPPEKLHITLFYKKGLTDEQRSAAARVFVDACMKLKGGGLRVKLGGIGRFSASGGSDGKDVIYASVDSPSLQLIRQAMAQRWSAEGIDPDVEHTFTPHVTLAYVDPSAPTPVHRLDPVEFTVTKATLKESVTLEDVFVVRVVKPLPKKRDENEFSKAGTGGLVRKAVVKIPHLDELEDAEFESVLRSLRDGTARVTEKVDGSAHVTFGLDGNGLWVRSKHGPVVRSPDGHVGPGAESLRWAHRTLERVSEGLSKAWPVEALCATADVIDCARPNVLPYSRLGLAVHGFFDRRGMRMDDESVAGVLGVSEAVFPVPHLTLGVSLAGPRDVVQESLVRRVAGLRSSLGPSHVEGVVVTTPDGVTAKVVDRGFFTALNSALWGPREALDRGEVRSGRRHPGVLENFRRSVVGLSGVPVLGSHHVVNRVRSSGTGDVDAMLENWTRSAGVFSREGSLDEARAAARNAIREVDTLWESVLARHAAGFDVRLTRADGSVHVEHIDMSHPVTERTARAVDSARSWLASLADSKTVREFVREFIGPTRLARINEAEAPPPSSPTQAVERYRELLSRRGLNVDVSRSLGSGYHGEAFELSNGKVLKVTDDADEVRAAQHLKGKKLRHVVNVFDVFSFPGGAWFGIVVERLKELPNDVKDVLMAINDRPAGGTTSYEQFVADLPPAHVKTLERWKFRELYDELVANKIVYRDWHGENVMTRGAREFVLADLGGDTISPGKVPPVIERALHEGGRTGSIGVTIGRFQPFHRGHGELIRRLAKKFDRVVVIVGGSKGGERNPFSWKTRLDMMRRSLPDVWGKVIVRPAVFDGRPSGFVPGVISDMSKEEGSPIRSDTSFQVLVGPDRVADVRSQFERARDLNIDPSLASVEEMPEVRSPSGKSVSGTDVRAALVANDLGRLKELLDPQLVSNEHDFHEVVKNLRKEMNLREDASKTPSPKGPGGLSRMGGISGVMSSLKRHADLLARSRWKIDVTALRRLGFGLDGVAFDIGGNRVLKVTGDLPEAFSANFLVGKPSRFVVKIFDVFRLPDGEATSRGPGEKLPTHRRQGLFGIVEEKLTPLSPAEHRELNEAVSGLDREVKFFSRVRGLRPWKEIVGTMRDLAAAPPQRDVQPDSGDEGGSKSTVIQRAPSAAAASKERGRNVRVEDVERYLATLDKFNIGDMHDELVNYGIEFSDFYGGNVMKRGSNYVINDLGRSGGSGQNEPPRNLEHVMREEIRRLVEEVDQEVAVDAVLRNAAGLKSLFRIDAASTVETVRERDGQSYFFVKGKELRVSDDGFAAFALPLVGKKNAAIVNVFHAFSMDEGLSAALIERGLERLSPFYEKELASVIAFLDRSTKGAFSKDFGRRPWKEIISGASQELARYTMTMTPSPPGKEVRKDDPSKRASQDTSKKVAETIARFNLPKMNDEILAGKLSVTIRPDALRVRPDGSIVFFYDGQPAPKVRLPTLKALGSAVDSRVRGESAAFTLGSTQTGVRAGSSSWSSPRGSSSPRAKSRRSAP